VNSVTVETDDNRPARHERPATMRAVVVRRRGDASSLHPEQVAVPVPGPGQVLVRVLATTVISSEIASREGVSTAALPLVLGNDFVGTVVEAPTCPQLLGSRVIGGYGGYGYTRDGAWADYLVVDEADAFPVHTDIEVTTLAAMPGSFTAASGALRSLGEIAGKRLLIRGGTSGVGLAAASLAIDAGARVIATTRDPDKAEKLRALGIHEVIVDDGDLVARVRESVPGGVDAALDLLGVESLRDTLRCVHEFGVVCLTGLLRDQTNSIRSGEREDRAVPRYPHPLDIIPPTVRLTVGGVDGTARTPELVKQWIGGFETGRYRMPVDSVFTLDEIQQAHRRRADPSSFGKIVVLVGLAPTRTTITPAAPADTDL
jgi:NADPH:quinone reductase-like Zn-dependent oxidoreductase